MSRPSSDIGGTDGSTARSLARRLLRAARFAAIALILASATLAALIVALSQGWYRGTVKHVLEMQLAHLLDTPVSIASLNGPLYTGLVLRGVRIGPRTAPLVELAVLDVKWDLDRLLTDRRLVLESVGVVGLHTGVQRYADGSWRVPLLPIDRRTTTEDSPPDTSWLSGIDVHAFSLEQARLRIQWATDAGEHDIAARATMVARRFALPPAALADLPLTALLTLEMEPGHIGPASMEHGQLHATLSKDGRIVVHGTVRGDVGEVSLDADGKLPDSWNAAGDGTQDFELRTQASARRLNLRTLTGRSDLPEDFEGEITLRTPFGSGGGGYQWHLETATLRAGGIEVTANGAGTGTVLDALDVDFRVADLEPLLADLGASVRIVGALAGHAQLRGPVGMPLGVVQVDGKNLIAGDFRLGALAARLTSNTSGSVRIEQLRLPGGDIPLVTTPGAILHVKDDAVQIDDLEIRSRNQRIAASGTVTRHGYRDLHVTVDDLDVENVARMARLPDPPSGLVDADLTLDGPFAAPELGGHLLWMQPRIGFVGFDRVKFELEPDQHLLRATASVEDAGRTLLDIDAALPLEVLGDPAAILAASDTRVDIRGKQIDLGGLLQPFVPDVLEAVHAVAGLELVVTGGDPMPRVEGQFELTDGSVSIPVLRNTIAPIRGKLRLDGDALWVENLQAGPVGAAARASGQIALSGLTPTAPDLRLTFEGFPLSRSPAGRSDVEGTLTIGGSLDAPKIAGTLALREARFDVREVEDPVMKEIRIVTAGPDEAAEDVLRETAGPRRPDIFQRASLDVDVDVPHHTLIRGRGAELDIEGRVEVRKEPLEPIRLSGSTKVVRGSYNLYGRRFDVRHGTVTFAGGSQIDPVLDIEATYRVRDVTVLVYVTGRLSAAKLRLDSEPPLPETDVLAYLAFGRPASELTSSQQAGLDSAAVQIATGAGVAALREVLGGAFPVDTFDLRMEERDEPTKVAVGKYVTSNLFVSYGREFGTDPVDEVRIELRLNRNWSVGTNTSTGGDAGGDIIWRFEY